ncbi:hypothetical protein SKAU_G00292530 [Synaphobranchus kaupii]|uniref:Uncharacterized protein n=1 Tax=Synaphobranchus kaupii TaxID=118154 RepID=A0A9Q1EU65_SYNKA|nr:hypothetical protein SKAU_G00292530 [Synaphobranchus kaupii]
MPLRCRCDGLMLWELCGNIMGAVAAVGPISIQPASASASSRRSGVKRCRAAVPAGRGAPWWPELAVSGSHVPDPWLYTQPPTLAIPTARPGIASQASIGHPPPDSLTVGATRETEFLLMHPSSAGAGYQLGDLTNHSRTSIPDYWH